MEEEFKKRDEEDGVGEGSATNVEDGGMEGVGDVLEDILEGEAGVLKEGIEGEEVLEGGFEELAMDSDPSWETVRGEKEGILLDKLQDVFMGEGCLEVAAIGGAVDAGAEAGEEGEVLVKDGQVSGEKVRSSGKVEGIVKKKMVLNWKEAVVGGGERRKVGDVSGLSGDKVVGEEGADSFAESGRSGLDGGNKSKVKGNGGGPVKGCREIKFDEGEGGFLAADGETAHVDRGEVLECEKSLERALVGRILGRQVPFGFLHRELRKKWGKFGRAHLSMIGSNSFVCFFASKEVRDSLLKGGPWFVGNQLVGVARWSSEFEPSSLKGFSTPIWIRFPQLPLNLWLDQNL